MMDKELRELESILEAEQKLFEVHLKRLAEQQRHLIEYDPEGLRDSIDKINLLSQEARMLNRGRKSLIASISRGLKTNKKDIALSRLLNRFKVNNFKQIEHLRNVILNMFLKAAARKEINEYLINQSMNVIGQTTVSLDAVNSAEPAADELTNETFSSGQLCN
jgi:hypothetical protein